VLIEPPTPTPTAVPPTTTLLACANFTDEKSCITQLSCGWRSSLTAVGGTWVNK